MKKQVRIKSLLAMVLSSLLVLSSAPGLASATLAGDNGPIVYVEETEVEICDAEGIVPVINETEIIENEDECYEGDLSQVITTSPNGTNPVVAAEIASNEQHDEEITTATISPNDASGNHTIVFASEKDERICEDYVEEIEAEAVRIENESPMDEYCYYSSDAIIYRVLIDKNGKPLGAPVVVATVSGPEGVETNSNSYIELSYAPDQKTVVGLRFFDTSPLDNHDNVVPAVPQNGQKSTYGPKHVIERITIASGAIEQLVGPKFDPYMNVGYAQNGAIYFTQLICEKYCTRDVIEDQIIFDDFPTEGNSEVWYFAPGASTAKQLTKTPRINEYFLSASPDSKTLLVCDPDTSLYYTVNTATGEVTTLTIEDVSNPFYPLFFSPDGKSYLGTVGFRYKQQCENRMKASRALVNELTQAVNVNSTVTRGTAKAALDKFKDAVIINGLQNPDDWAPIVKFTTTTTTATTPQVLGTTTTKKATLQSTGSSVVAVIAVGFGVATLAGLSMVYRKKEN